MHRLFLAVLFGFAALSLAGCSSDKVPQTVGKLTCPGAFIAPGLDSYTVFRPGVAPSRNPNDVIFGVKLATVTSHCTTEATGIRVRTLLSFIAVRSDDSVHQGDFTYFVAIADAQKRISAKRDFALRVDFAPRQKEMRVYDDITEHLPLKNLALGSHYAVIVGLQVSQEQLKLNRQR